LATAGRRWRRHARQVAAGSEGEVPVRLHHHPRRPARDAGRAYL